MSDNPYALCPQRLARFIAPAASEARTPAGWPTPRQFMRDPAAIRARLIEDAIRLIAERGEMTVFDLIALWGDTDTVCARYEAVWAELIRRGYQDSTITFDDDPDGGGTPARPTHLFSDDIAFGCDRVAA